MKKKAILLISLVIVMLFSGCAQQTPQNGAQTTTQDQTQNQTGAQTTTTAPDAVSSASIVDNESAFEKAISNEGTWIICLTKDLTISKDITLEGEYKNGKKDDAGKDIIQRKIALYAQDADRNITARYTLTAPKFTILSPEASLQHGTFKGDLYVNVNNFKLIDTTVEGNVYFASEEFKNSFNADEKSKITGKQEVKAQ